MEKNKINNLLLLSLASREILHAAKNFFADLGIDMPVESIKVLLVVYYSNEDAIQQEIADAVKKDKSTILRLVDNLEEKNLVQRIVDPNDRRRNIIRVTEDGIGLINKINSKLEELYSLLSEGIKPADLDIFVKVLGQFRAKVATV